MFIPSSNLGGFEYGKVGPKDGSDFVGGNYISTLNLVNLPYLFENAQNLDMLLFFDAANIWGVDYDSSNDDSNKIRSSIGVGLDWFLIGLSFFFIWGLSKGDGDVTGLLDLI